MVKKIVEQFKLEINSKEGSRVYAIFDGVKFPLLWIDLEDGVLQYDMLFKEEKRRKELWKVAPYLVELNFEKEMLDESKKLLEGYGENGAIFFVTSLSFEESLEKMRNIFNIDSTDGERGYFRFYNPSIFIELIKHNNYNLVRDVFHNINAYFLEDIEENNELMKYWSKDENIYQTQLTKGIMDEN